MTKTTKNKSIPAKAPAKRKTKASIVESLLIRKDGASLEAICRATGWQVHSCRAFLTGLRKKGREVVRYKDDRGASLYKMTPVESDGMKA